MKKRRILAVIFALAITVGALGGCGEKQQGQEDSGELKEVTTGDTYPLETDVTLRYWMQMNANYSAVRNSMNDSILKENLEKQTGVKLEFEHPVAGQEQEAFNILQSSGDAPDIIEWSWSSYPGGPDTAIEDGIIVPLNSYIDKVSPNLKKILEENPSWAQQLTTDSGYLYQYPFIRPSDVLSTYVTYMIRKDLLDKGGLEEPETLEEWDTVLHAFLDMGVETPLMMKYNNAQLELFSPFMSCFDIAGTFYHDENNTVKFGPYEENFRSWVAQMRKWYEEGILDKEFADVTVSRMDAVIANGKNGAYYDGVSSIARYKQSAADPSIQYIPLKVPTKTKGELAMYGQKDFPVLDCAAISMDSEHKEIAARFLDFGYSEAGHLLYNFGVEGESFTYQDTDRGTHIPTYIPELLEPETNGGLTLYQSLTNYVRGTYTGPFVQDEEYIYQVYKYDEQKMAFDRWNTRTLDYKLPMLYMSTEESKRLNDIMTPIDTYREETIARIISGKLPLEEMDTYFSELKRMGIEEAIALKQAAYDRYLQREPVAFSE